MRLLLMIIAAAVLTGCVASKTELKIMQMNALSSEKSNDGGFRGLEFLADTIQVEDSKARLNIFYLHGIGRTENPEEAPLARTFLEGVAKSYGLDIAGNTLNSQCGIVDNVDKVRRNGSRIEISAADQPITYQTIIPGVPLKLDRLVCMDKQILSVTNELEFVVYRIFWDEFFWEGLQYAHIGQDVNSGESGLLANLRRKYNRRLKDEMVNYGFSDAVMYLGPAGQDIRNAIKGAMCSASLDAGGYQFKLQGDRISAANACALAERSNPQTNQFAFVSESLGSKITFDLMREALTDDQETVIDRMIAGSEIYMLANQLALLSLSDISKEPVKPARNAPYQPRPKIVALSEINDFLTYEVNPFIENLWASQSVPEGEVLAPLDSAARENISRILGFDFVDIRLEFADPIISVVSDFVDPLQAHSKHVAEPELIELLLCGAVNGEMSEENCLAEQGLESDDS